MVWYGARCNGRHGYYPSRIVHILSTLLTTPTNPNQHSTLAIKNSTWNGIITESKVGIDVTSHVGCCCCTNFLLCFEPEGAAVEADSDKLAQSVGCVRPDINTVCCTHPTNRACAYVLLAVYTMLCHQLHVKRFAQFYHTIPYSNHAPKGECWRAWGRSVISAYACMNFITKGNYRAPPRPQRGRSIRVSPQ